MLRKEGPWEGAPEKWSNLTLRKYFATLVPPLILNTSSHCPQGTPEVAAQKTGAWWSGLGGHQKDCLWQTGIVGIRLMRLASHFEVWPTSCRVSGPVWSSCVFQWPKTPHCQARWSQLCQSDMSDKVWGDFWVVSGLLVSSPKGCLSCLLPVVSLSLLSSLSLALFSLSSLSLFFSLSFSLSLSLSPITPLSFCKQFSYRTQSPVYIPCIVGFSHRKAPCGKPYTRSIEICVTWNVSHFFQSLPTTSIHLVCRFSVSTLCFAPGMIRREYLPTETPQTSVRFLSITIVQWECSFTAYMVVSDFPIPFPYISRWSLCIYLWGNGSYVHTYV